MATEESVDMEEIELNESFIEEIEESEFETISIEEKEDLFNKNTPSFQCLAQIEISRSSLLLEPFYYFPEIEDVHLDDLLWEVEQPPVYDDIGVERFRDLCKKLGIFPYRRIINSLDTDTLDLRYYCLEEQLMHAVCETLQYNKYVKYVKFEENPSTPEALLHVAALVEFNQTIISLDLTRCNIGYFGAISLENCFSINHTLVELNLSHNNLGDDGMERLEPGLRENKSIKVLNLSHNNMAERAMTALASVLEENYTIHNLDLSWNYFYFPDGKKCVVLGMRNLMTGLKENISVESLNLAANGIGNEDNFRPILVYFKSGVHRLLHLDLSSNRITGGAVKMLRNGLKANESLITLNLALNPLTAEEIEFISKIFLITREAPITLTYIDFGHKWVNTSFIPMHAQIREKGCDVKIGGIYSNYVIYGPNIAQILLRRAKLMAWNPREKKYKKDFGQFVLQFPEGHVTKDKFLEMIRNEKLKLDYDLLQMMMKHFTDDTKQVDLDKLKGLYLTMYPDTTLAPEKKPKEKKKKGKKEKKGKKKKAK